MGFFDAARYTNSSSKLSVVSYRFMFKLPRENVKSYRHKSPITYY